MGVKGWWGGVRIGVYLQLTKFLTQNSDYLVYFTHTPKFHFLSNF